MGDNDLTQADKEAILLAAGWSETAEGRWVKMPEGITRDTIDEAYALEFSEE
jgi:hypothetical protein